MFRLPTLLFCLYGLCGMMAIAQEVVQPAPLSLEECIAIALSDQSDILIGGNNVQVATQRVVQAKSSYYPQISLNADALANSENPLNDVETGSTLTVTQTFYDGGLRESRVRGAKANVTQNACGLARTQQSVVFVVTRDYFNLLRAQRLAEVSATQVHYLEEQLRLIQSRVQLGDAAPADAVPVEATLANARVDLLAAQNAVRTTAIQLQQHMGISTQEEFAVQDYSGATDVSLASTDEYISQAYLSRPDLTQARAAIDIAKANTSTAKINLYPRPVLSGRFEQPLFNGDDSRYLISGGIEFDIYDGGYNKAFYRETQFNQSSAEIRAVQLAKDIRAEVQNAYLNVVNARERLAASEFSLRAAQINFNVQEERYTQGLAISLDLLNAQFDLVRAQSTAVQAQYDYYTALAQLAYATGTQGACHEA